MAAPALRVPLSLNMDEFKKNINEAKSLTSTASQFLLKEFTSKSFKLAIDSKEFKSSVDNAAKYLGQQFEKVKPQIQAGTQYAVREAIKDSTEVAGRLTAVFAAPAVKGAFQAFTAVGVPAAQGLAQALAPLALRAFAVYTAFELVSGAIGAAREQLERMVAVADKASDRGVSAVFLQSFEAEAKKLKVTVEELDQALSHAFEAGKDKSPIDVGKWQVADERISDVELALRVYNQEIQKATGKTLEGLVLFRDAKTQDDRVQAILKSMVQLEQAGQRLAALELGDKFFGVQFVDRIRQGKTSAEELLTTIQKIRDNPDTIFSDAMVRRAKEVDDQLKLSEDRLKRALKPNFEDLADTILTIKGYWADIVGFIGQAIELTNRLTGDSIEGMKEQLESLREAEKNRTGVGGIPRVPGADAVRSALGLNSIDQSLRLRIEELERRIAAREGRTEGPLRRVEIRSRGTGAAPTLRDTGAERTPFDAAIEQVEKRIAVLREEAKTIDQTSAARERAKTVAILEEAAKKANTAAGKANAEVTKEQREAIEREADAILKVITNLEKARVESRLRFESGTAFLTQSDVAIAQQLSGIYGRDIPAALNSTYASAIRVNEATREIANTISSNLTSALADAADGTKTWGQAFADFSKVAIRAIQEVIIKLLIVQPLMRSIQGGIGGFDLGSLFGGGGGGAITLGGAGGPTPFFAAGTSYAPGGWSIVGENGPELRRLNRGDQIIPADVTRRLVGGTQVTVPIAIDARGADEAGMARVEAQIAILKASLPSTIVATVKKAQSGRTL